jgi:hypothetical protein
VHRNDETLTNSGAPPQLRWAFLKATAAMTAMRASPAAPRPPVTPAFIRDGPSDVADGGRPLVVEANDDSSMRRAYGKDGIEKLIDMGIAMDVSLYMDMDIDMHMSLYVP